MSKENYAIRFGLGAIKAVGLKMMEDVVKKRKNDGKFVDIYDFAKKVDSKSVNKKSVEALAKAGAFDNILKNRRQIFESFDILSSYSQQQQEEASSDQMNFFGEMIAKDKAKPELRAVEDWSKAERLQREFEAFGFFLNEHPLDDKLDGLRKRGIVFCDKIERDELEDNDLIKMAGVVASSKHRSSVKGRFAYMTVSDPYGIFEAMIFDEVLITKARDIMVDGSQIYLEALIRKDEGGIRILVRDLKKLDDFMKNVEIKDEAFEDIRKQKKRKNYDINFSSRSFEKGDFGGLGGGGDFSGGLKKFAKKEDSQDIYKKRLQDLEVKKICEEIVIFIKDRDAIFSLKAFLAVKLAPANFVKFSKVILCVGDTKIELPQQYLLDDSDITKLRMIPAVAKVLM